MPELITVQAADKMMAMGDQSLHWLQLLLLPLACTPSIILHCWNLPCMRRVGRDCSHGKMLVVFALHEVFVGRRIVKPAMTCRGGAANDNLLCLFPRSFYDHTTNSYLQIWVPITSLLNTRVPRFEIKVYSRFPSSAQGVLAFSRGALVFTTKLGTCS